MEQTAPQLTFLADLRCGPRRADAHLDASMVTRLGAFLLAEHEASRGQIAPPA